MAYDVNVTRLPLQAVFDLKGPKDAVRAWCGDALPPFPERPNSLTRRGPDTLCHVGPERWLILADLAREATLDSALRPTEAPPEISIVRISDTLAFFRITGPEAAEILAQGCPLDLHATAFGPDAASLTEFFGLRALVLRCEDGFDCAVEQSFGPTIADFLAKTTA